MGKISSHFRSKGTETSYGKWKDFASYELDPKKKKKIICMPKKVCKMPCKSFNAFISKQGINKKLKVILLQLV